jgi:hypothetical protein
VFALRSHRLLKRRSIETVYLEVIANRDFPELKPSQTLRLKAEAISLQNLVEDLYVTNLIGTGGLIDGPRKEP